MSSADGFADALTRKGLKAFYGQSWDGTSDHHEPEFWYFHPRDNGGVAAFVTYDEMYDMYFLGPFGLADALTAVEALGVTPTRKDVTRAISIAFERGGGSDG